MCFFPSCYHGKAVTNHSELVSSSEVLVIWIKGKKWVLIAWTLNWGRAGSDKPNRPLVHFQGAESLLPLWRRSRALSAGVQAECCLKGPPPLPPGTRFTLSI